MAIWRFAVLGALLAGCSSSQLEEDAAVELEAGAEIDGQATQADSIPRHDGKRLAVEPRWIRVAAGSFSMGSPPNESCRRDDEDQHPVEITRSFDLAETETTQEQFQAAMGYNPSFRSSCGAQCPVEWVSWHEAAAYCNALSEARALTACYACSGKGPEVTCQPAGGNPLVCSGFRLPTEAELEYATRAGTTTALPSGDITSCMGSDPNAQKIAWYKANSTGLPRPVKGKEANAWGFFDLTGNVYEWAQDWYQPRLGTAAVKDPQGPATGTQRVFRGGAWYFNAEHLRSAHRLAFSPSKRFTFLGFRCARTRP
jgi:formylglycine-generating enzyme required for sulfatase activity